MLCINRVKKPINKIGFCFLKYYSYICNMTKYYLEVMKEGVSICLDTDVRYYHQFEIGDIIHINMYSDKGPKVVFGGYAEYDAEFTLDWDRNPSARLTVASCITKGYLADVTKSVERQEKLKQLGI
jgi:hypothetical protein